MLLYIFNYALRIVFWKKMSGKQKFFQPGPEGRQAQRKRVCFIKLFSWGTKFESSFQQKDAKSFSRANFSIKCDPNSSKYVSGILELNKALTIGDEL